MRKAGISGIRVIVSVAALLLAGGAVAFENVVLQRPAGSSPPSPEYGVLLFGRSTVHKFGPGPTPIDIQSPNGGLTSLVAYTAGLPPVLGTRTPGAGATLTFHSPLVIPIKVWALCANATCDGPFTHQLEEKLDTFLFEANEFFERERTGLVLGKAGETGGAGWISDQTANAAKRDRFKNFSTAPDNDDCSHLGLLTHDMKETGALNMYLVGLVDGNSGRGESCLEPDISVIGATALWHTMLHEIGHNLGLLHVDGRQIRHYVPTENLMHKASSDRRFVSEGQTFLIYFDGKSALKQVFSNLLPAQWPFRDCTNSEVECPPLTTWIWDDRD